MDLDKEELDATRQIPQIKALIESIKIDIKKKKEVKEIDER